MFFGWKNTIFLSTRISIFFPLFQYYDDYFNRSGSQIISSVLKFRADLDSIDKPGLPYVPKRVFKKLIPTRRKLHFFSSNAVSLEGEPIFESLLGTISQPVFDRKIERSSKIQYRRWGFMLKDLKNHSKSVKSFRLKNEES